MMTLEQIWSLAQSAANSAPKYMDQGIQGPCGFAWIRVSGRGKFAKFAKEVLGAHKNYGGSGLNIWYSAVYDCKGGQNVDDHEIACSAAAKVLNKYGIPATVYSRLD